MKIPKDLSYTKSHEWVEFVDDTTVKVGLTDYAQNSLGDLVFINLPETEQIGLEETLADVESVKAVSDVYSPVSGTVTKVNEELLDNPGLINEDPYGAWIAEIVEVTEQAEFLDAEAYEAFCRTEE